MASSKTQSAKTKWPEPSSKINSQLLSRNETFINGKIQWQMSCFYWIVKKWPTNTFFKLILRLWLNLKRKPLLQSAGSIWRKLTEFEKRQILERIWGVVLNSQKLLENSPQCHIILNMFIFPGHLDKNNWKQNIFQLKTALTGILSMYSWVADSLRIG